MCFGPPLLCNPPTQPVPPYQERAYIPARDYFSEAKRRTAHLKTLKSVSRAYRKLAVRDLKQKAMAQRDLRRIEELYRAGSNSHDDV